MAIAEVGRIASGNAASQSTQSVSITANTTAGNRAILLMRCGNGAKVNSVTDSRGNTWSVDEVSSNTTQTRISICSALLGTALQSGDTLTVTLNAAAAAVLGLLGIFRDRFEQPGRCRQSGQ